MAPSDLVRNALYKTELCRYHSAGACAKDHCPFAHAETELRERPDLMKTTFCRAHRERRCTQGKLCPFAHKPSEIRNTEGVYKTQLCIFYQNGHCKKGENCRHVHEMSELRRGVYLTPYKKTEDRSYYLI